ncbi:hypothetical protein V1509DRAFT_194602 [Lipomyces kononenkoae]
MDKSAGGVAKSAPYGQACTNCVRAKCRCILRNLGNTCERCYRLHKECIRSDTVRKRPKGRVTSRSSQLEQKLDDLMVLLKSSPHTQTTETSASKSGSKLGDVGIETVSNSLCSTDSESISDSREDRTMCISSHVEPFMHLCSTSALSQNYTIPIIFEPTQEDANQYLKDFRTQKLEHFAFLSIDPATSSDELRQERPFLWLCIMAISCPSTSDQIRLGNGIRQIVSQKVVINGERNLDLLLGIMIFVGWAQYQVHSGPLLTVFTQLALSLLYDLELHTSVGTDSALTFGWWARHSKFAIPTTRTMEHRRAALGCFLLNSITVPSHRKQDRLHWTPYLEECLQIMEEKLEYPTDERFVHQIRIQLIANKAVPYPIHNGNLASAENITMSNLYIKGLKLEILEAKSKIPAHLINDMILMTQLHYVEVMVNDVALTNAITVCPDEGSFRVEYLSACLNSLKTWFDLFFQYHPSVYTRFSWSTFEQMKYCFFMLGRLSTLEDPAWDKRLVQNTFDILRVLQQLASNLRQVKPLTGLQIDGVMEDVFTKFYRQVVSLQSWWESNMEFGSIVTKEIPSHHPEVAPTADCSSDWDNSWLQDLLGIWEV